MNRPAEFQLVLVADECDDLPRRDGWRLSIGSPVSHSARLWPRVELLAALHRSLVERSVRARLRICNHLLLALLVVAARSRGVLLLLGWVLLLGVVVGGLACALLPVCLRLPLVATTRLLLALRRVGSSLGSLLLRMVAITARSTCVLPLVVAVLLSAVVVLVATLVVGLLLLVAAVGATSILVAVVRGVLLVVVSLLLFVRHEVD